MYNNKCFDLSGQTFGKWMVLSRTDKDKTGKTQWLCRCACGTEQAVRTSALRRRKTSSCIKCSNRSYHFNCKRPYEGLYTSICYIAKKYNMEVLSYEEFITFTHVKECTYCGFEIKWELHRVRGHLRYNLDRKDNSKGYLFENLAVCCKDCNYAKADRFSFEEMLMLSPVLRSIRELRKESALALDEYQAKKKGENARTD